MKPNENYSNKKIENDGSQSLYTHSDRNVLDASEKSVSPNIDSHERLSKGWATTPNIEDLLDYTDRLRTELKEQPSYSRLYLDELMQSEDKLKTLPFPRRIKFSQFHTPFEIEAVDFFVNVIKWNTNISDNIMDNLRTQIAYETILRGEIILYETADGTTILKDVVPIFDDRQANNFIGVGYIEKKGEDDEPVAVYHFNDGTIYRNGSKQKTKAFDVFRRLRSTYDGLPFYDNVIGLMQSYDKSQENTRDYMDNLATAQLIIYGGNETIERRVLKKLGKASVISLPNDPNGNHGTAEYIHKEYDVKGDESYKNRLADDIKRYMALPSFVDLSGNVSADTLRIKMTSTTQRARSLASFMNEDNYFSDVDATIDYGFEFEDTTDQIARLDKIINEQ